MFESNTQIKYLMDQGLSLDEAAASLGLDVDAAALAVASGQKVKSIQQLIEEFRPTAIKVLMDVAKFGENESARVKAAQILLEGKGVMPETSAAMLSEKLQKMKQAVALIDQKEPELIDI